MNKDQIKGMANQATGEIKEQVGKMTGDKSTELKGDLRQAKGKAQEKLGDAKDTLDENKERDIELNRGNEDLDRMGR
jgi:uncharacterized protein YjbJ (UPF0337 family)